MAVLAADVGGSKTLLGLFSSPGTAPYMHMFDNHLFENFTGVLQAFLTLYTAVIPQETTLTVAIAGPVQDNRRCQMTNLPWLIEAESLKNHFGFRQVVLLNDLEATAWAMPSLQANTSLISLNDRKVNFQQPVAVISVGTGLGQALLLPEQARPKRVLPAEGGHKQFAPFDLASARILTQAYEKGAASVSWEQWFSGSGLPHLFNAMYPDHPALTSAQITEQAQSQPDSPAARCIHQFCCGLMAEAGNVALQYWSEGGVILAGGVVQHVRAWLENPAIQTYFNRKQQHGAWLQTRPINLCEDTGAALKGAAAFGWQLSS